MTNVSSILKVRERKTRGTIMPKCATMLLKAIKVLLTLIVVIVT